MTSRNKSSPTPSLTLSTSSTHKSLSRTLSSASSSYNTKFLSAFKPTVKKPSLEPILIPGLDGILSNSGVAKVFDLDPRNLKPEVTRRGLAKVLKRIPGCKKDKGEEGGLRVKVRARGDKLPKHSNVFTGMPTPDASAINSVYPSSSGETSAEEGDGGERRGMGPSERELGDHEDIHTATQTPRLAPEDFPTRPRRERQKSVTFSLSSDHDGLERMPSVHEPSPESWPGATPEEVERYEHARHADAEKPFLGCGCRRPWRKRMELLQIHYYHRRPRHLRLLGTGRKSGGTARKRLHIRSVRLGNRREESRSIFISSFRLLQRDAGEEGGLGYRQSFVMGHDWWVIVDCV
jgi:hypothetical protein